MLKKYLFLSVIFILIFSFSHESFSAPIYGTHMPKKKHFICGLEESIIIDRNLDNNEGAVNGRRSFFTLSYGIFPWFSFDGKIGIGDVDWERIGVENLNYSTNFSGGYGFRIKGYENKSLGIKSALGFQHISVHPGARNQNSEKNGVIIDEWQGSLVISKDFKYVTPYLGTRYGSVDFIKWVNEANRKRIKSEKEFGIIIGLDYWLDDRTKLNLEALFLDGEEVAIGISRDF